MTLHRGKMGLACALALVWVGCAADGADLTDEASDAVVEAEPVLALQADVASADRGSSSGGESEDDGGWTISEGSNTGTARTGGGWDAASVARFCFLLDSRAQFLCRVTLTDCTKPARPLDFFTQALCQVRGFLPGAPSASSGASAAPEADADYEDVGPGI